MLNRMTKIAVSAAALMGVLAFAAPASAATYPGTQYAYTYRAANWGTIWNWFAPKAPTTQTQPKTTPAPTTTTQTNAGLTAEEQQMLNLVNGERAKAGLSPLKADLQLTKLARMKSQDMINRNYFSHQSPTYGSPFDMMKTYGVTYQTAGENLAGNSTVSAAHTALMNSAGHRANILNGKFNYVGIGIIKGGNYGMMFTQMFVGR